MRRTRSQAAVLIPSSSSVTEIQRTTYLVCSDLHHLISCVAGGRPAGGRRSHVPSAPPPSAPRAVPRGRLFQHVDAEDLETDWIQRSGGVSCDLGAWEITYLEGFPRQSLGCVAVIYDR